MRRSVPVAVLVACYGGMTLAGYLAFRRFPDQSTRAWLQFVSLYVLTVLYPVIWRAQHQRVLRRRGLADDAELQAYTWAPVVVGGTGFLIVLTLLVLANR